MAKKVKTSSGKKTIDIVDLFAYIALVFAAVIFIINLILKALGGNLGSIMGYMTIIKDISIGCALGFGGWSFTRRRHIALRVLYVISLITYVVCLILLNVNIT